MASTPPYTNRPPTGTGSSYHISQQQTYPAVPVPSIPPVNETSPDADEVSNTKPKLSFKRIVPIVLALALVLAIFFIWNTSTPTNTLSSGSGISQQNFGSGSSSTTTRNTTGSTSLTGTIEVYIVGAVKHPGVYTLPADARVYELLQAAGGPLPKANLVALNLAAKLTDGQEVYVTLIGEIPPSYMGGVPGPGTGTNGSTGGAGNTSTGQLVNINTASIDEMRQNLHISSTTAQAIVNYRLQHGPYSSVDQLLQVVSKEIYDKIKDQVTV